MGVFDCSLAYDPMRVITLIITILTVPRLGVATVVAFGMVCKAAEGLVTDRRRGISIGVTPIPQAMTIHPPILPMVARRIQTTSAHTLRLAKFRTPNDLSMLECAGEH